MQNEEQNLIAHLLDVEEKAGSLIMEAQEQNDILIASSRARADSEYDEKFKAMCDDLEDEYNKRIKIFDAALNASADSFKEKISKTDKDVQAFDRAAGLYLADL